MVFKLFCSISVKEKNIKILVYCFYSPFIFEYYSIYCAVYIREDAVNAHPNTFFLTAIYR